MRAMIRLELARKAGLELQLLGGKDGIAKCWHPNRFKRVYAAEGEESVPYLRPYDVFNYMPVAADWLSKTKTKNLSTYILTPGMILQTASGRNLGPAVAVDSYIAKFVLGDDMIRVEIASEIERCFILTFLKSPTGQQLLQRDKTGSVIDHISPAQLGEQLVPRFTAVKEREISDKMKEAIETREKAREIIQSELDSFEAQLPSIDRKNPRKHGWTVRASNLGGRLDAAPRDPILEETRQRLLMIGGQETGLHAKVVKPAGRYKTRYVEKEYGIPILSGTQALQASPIKLQYMVREALQGADRYTLSAKSIVFQADGRAEEGLGFPAVVTPDRDGWFASGHVGRLIPKDGTESGWLYLAVRTRHVQTQLRALACGSVVDALYEDDIKDVVLPPPLKSDAKKVTHAWELFAQAQAAEDDAIARFESVLSAAVGDVPS
jgi:hypothetical protein